MCVSTLFGDGCDTTWRLGISLSNQYSGFLNTKVGCLASTCIRFIRLMFLFLDENWKFCLHFVTDSIWEIEEGRCIFVAITSKHFSAIVFFVKADSICICPHHQSNRIHWTARIAIATQCERCLWREAWPLPRIKYKNIAIYRCCRWIDGYMLCRKVFANQIALSSWRNHRIISRYVAAMRLNLVWKLCATMTTNGNLDLILVMVVPPYQSSRITFCLCCVINEEIMKRLNESLDSFQ